jgi:hypothetical protein
MTAQSNYKVEKQATRNKLRQLKRGTPIWWGGASAHLGIKEFKRQNKGNNYLIAVYKENFWASVRSRMQEKK